MPLLNWLQVHHLHQHRGPGQLGPGVAHCAGAAVPCVWHGAGRRCGARLRGDPRLEQPLQAHHRGVRCGCVVNLASMQLQRASCADGIVVYNGCQQQIITTAEIPLERVLSKLCGVSLQRGR